MHKNYQHYYSSREYINHTNKILYDYLYISKVHNNNVGQVIHSSWTR